VDDRTRDLLRAVFGSVAGGFLAAPPGFDGRPGLGLAGITGVPRAREWDVVASAECPALLGDELSFATLADGTLILDGDQPEGAVAPLADAVEHRLAPPYRAEALRRSETVWAVAARHVLLRSLPSEAGEHVDASRVAGETTVLNDDVPTRGSAELHALLDESTGDVAITADWLTDATWIVERWPL
jgi:hypothetical protein